MPKNSYRSNAVRRTEIRIVTIDAAIANGKYRLYIPKTGKGVEVTGSDDAGAIAVALAEAWNLSEAPELQEITATAELNRITLKHTVPGIPFEINVETPPVVRVETIVEGKPAINAQYRITLPVGTVGGDWDLTITANGIETTFLDMAHNITPAALETAILTHAQIVATDVQVTGNVGGPFFIELIDPENLLNFDAITADGADLFGAASVAVKSLSEPGDDVDHLVAVYVVPGSDPGLMYIRYGAGGARTEYNGVSMEADLSAAAGGPVTSYIVGAVTVVGDPGAITLFKFSGTAAGTSHPQLLVESDAGIGYGWSVVLQNGGGGVADHWSYFFPNFGQFTLTANGETTATISPGTGNDLTPMLAALEALPSIAVGDVEFAQGSPLPIHGLLHFTNNLAGTAIGLSITQIEANTALQVQHTEISLGHAPKNELQQVIVDADAGTTVPTLYTAGSALTWPFTAAQLKTEIDLQDAPGPVDVVTDITGDGSASNPFRIEYTAPAGTNIPLLVFTTNNLKGGLNASISTIELRLGIAHVNEIQSVVMDPFAVGGTVTFQIQLPAGGEVTDAIAYNAGGAAFDTGIESAVGAGNASVLLTGPGVYRVTFEGDLRGTNVGQLFPNADNLVTSSESAISVVTAQYATGPHHWNDPLNWSLERVPDPTDDAYLEEPAACRYGMRQLGSFVVDPFHPVASDPIKLIVGRLDLIVGQGVRVTTDGTLPTFIHPVTAVVAALDPTVTYYVVTYNREIGELQISHEPGGAPFFFPTDGSGTHLIGCRLNSLTHFARNNQHVGLPRRNEGDYVEYRDTGLTIGFDSAGSKACVIGFMDGDGSSLMRLATLNDEVDLVIYKTGGTAELNTPACIISTQGAGSTIKIIDGNVGISVFTEDVATTLKQLVQLAGSVRAGGLVINNPGKLAYERLTGELFADHIQITGQIVIGN